MGVAPVIRSTPKGNSVDSKNMYSTAAGHSAQEAADAESGGNGSPEISEAPSITTRDVVFSSGARFMLGKLAVELVHCLSLDRVVVAELRTGETRVVARAELTPVEAMPHGQLERAVKSDDVTEEMLVRARACEEALLPYLGAGTLSHAEARHVAKTLGVSTRTVRRWIQRYKRQGDITAFLPAPRGIRRGQSSLDPAVEAIIEFAVRRKLRDAGNCTVRSVKEAIRADCEAIDKTPPAASTVLGRIKKLKADADALPSEVGRQVRERQRLVRGSAEAQRPLERVEIDHTLVDTHIVDAKDGGPLGRPWLTIAIDVFTRVILGFYLALEYPSRLSLALCLRHAILPKDNWLKRVAGVGPWPVFGRPRRIYTDNGADFRSLSFRLGCQRQHIENGYRPVRQPRYGGTVERLIGTFMRRMRLIPGNTFNEILNKKSPYAAHSAVLRLEDLERWFTNEVTAYHHETHRTLGAAPIAAWNRAWKTSGGVVVPTYPADAHTLFTDLLPHESRVVDRAGIHLYQLRYRCDELAPYVNSDIKRVIRFDPRDISVVWLERPDGGYLEVPWTNRAWPRLSLWEWNEIRHRNGQRDKEADPEIVRQCLAENDRLIAERAAQGQLRARRRRARSERWGKEVSVSAPSEGPTAAPLKGRDARRRKPIRPAEALPPLPRTQLDVTLASVESPVAFEVLE